MIRGNILMTIVAMAATSAFAAPALAWEPAQFTEQVLSVGRVVKVEVSAGKVTIEHKPILRLYMESMIMIFKVRDSTLLTGLTPGDRIRFRVERDGDEFVVTKIENASW